MSANSAGGFVIQTEINDAALNDTNIRTDLLIVVKSEVIGEIWEYKSEKRLAKK